jgi:hypothetical protein
LLYYLEHPEAIGLAASPIEASRVIDAGALGARIPVPHGDFLLVHTAGFIDRQRRATALVTEALASCRTIGTQDFLPDPAAALKQQLGQDGGHRAARIELVRLSCPGAETPAQP